MLLRFAKIAGGLRAVVTEAGPLIATSVGLLSARTVAYTIGFTLGSIVSIWLPIIATLISVTGFWGAGTNTLECETYRAQMRTIDAANRALMASYELTLRSYYIALNAYNTRYTDALRSLASNYNGLEICRLLCASDALGSSCWGCMEDVGLRYRVAAADAAGTPPIPPAPPTFQSYPACSSPNCPPGKKVWTQVLWASPTDNFTDTKGCYIVAYSQDAPDLPVTVEYNPFLPDLFVKSRALSYYLVNGDRYRGLQDSEWSNLESVAGWDKGYWRSEFTDSECRGWRPGWSRQVK